jgi:hypothetical protein
VVTRLVLLLPHEGTSDVADAEGAQDDCVHSVFSEISPIVK